MKKIIATLLVLVTALSFSLFASCGTDTSGACAHTETEEIVINATCTTGGKIVTKCKNPQCNKVLSTETTQPLGHLYEAGFCTRTGCVNPTDPANNRFYANLITSILNAEKVTAKNADNVIASVGETDYTFTDVTLLGGKTAGETAENGEETGVKELFSFDLSGDKNFSIKIVSDKTELKLLVKADGEELAYARADGEAVKKVIESYKEEIKDATGSIPGLNPGEGGSQTGGLDYATLVTNLVNAIKTADGDDATVKSINTGLHNIVVSIAKITETTDGYEITLDAEKLKAFNHTIATQTVENFVNNMFGAKSFDTVKLIITSAVKADTSVPDDQKDAKANEVVSDCQKSDLYTVIDKYDDKEQSNEIEKTINEAIDSLSGLTLSLFTDKKGNALSAKIKAENFQLIGDITIPPITIGKVETEPVTIHGVILNGEFNINFPAERVTETEYAAFNEAESETDTDLAAGEHEGFLTYNGNCQKVTFTVDENGNITSVTSYFKLNENVPEGTADYYKVVCKPPVAVMRNTDEGKIVYTINNLIASKDFKVILNVEIYETDENFANGTLVTDDAIIGSIASSIDEVEFTLVTTE